MEAGRLPRSAAAFALGHLVGSFPTADIVTRLAGGEGADLRRVGSGNPGATNAAAELGTAWGAAVLAGDVAKAVVACRIGERIDGVEGASVAGTGSVTGHCFPIITGRSGGKGVATAIGQAVATTPAALPSAALASVVAATPPWPRRSLAAAAAWCLSWPVGAAVSHRTVDATPSGSNVAARRTAPVLAAVASAAIVAGRFAAAER